MYEVKVKLSGTNDGLVYEFNLIQDAVRFVGACIELGIWTRDYAHGCYKWTPKDGILGIDVPDEMLSMLGPMCWLPYYRGRR